MRRRLLMNGGGGEYLAFMFDQNPGTKKIITPINDTGFLDYLVENTKPYVAKYQEDGSMLVCPVKKEIQENYAIAEPQCYWDGFTSEIFIKASNRIYTTDFMAIIPTIYYKCYEASPDKFVMKFAVEPFEGCKQVFGEDYLIAMESGRLSNNRFYANGQTFGEKLSFTEARAAITSRGEGYYGMTSEERGVLYFLQCYIYNDIFVGWSGYHGILGINGGTLVSGGNRHYIPNIEFENMVATVHHLDGIDETFQLPSLWGTNFSKLIIGEYLTILPKEAGNGIYGKQDNWIDNKGIGIYLPNNTTSYTVGFSADRNDETIKQLGGWSGIRIRPCFKGKIVETLESEWFDSLPIIN